ncbi:MAG: PorT family protein [Bacteroidales bacterium]|nr:PorT family protein [Bacteroidales bacterium]
MKIRSVIFLICMFMFVSATSQDLVRWGVKFGLDVPTNKSDFRTDIKYKKTFNYNVGFQLRVGERFYGHAEVDYIINKCTLDYLDYNDTTNQNTTHSIELGYLAVPLQAGYSILQFDHFALRALLGVQYRVLVRLSKNDINLKRTDMNVHNLDFIGGLGVDIYSFTLDIGYRKSLLAVMPKSKHYRDMLTLSIGLIF